MSNYDDDLQTHIKNKGVNYTSVDSQNEIISLLAAHVINKIVPTSGEFYSLIADATMDLSKKGKFVFVYVMWNEILVFKKDFLVFFLQTLLPQMRSLIY